MQENFHCPYCLEFVHKASKPILHTIGWPYRSRGVYQTELTVIAPTIGAIVPNYLLLIPLRHTFAIQYLSHDEMTDLRKCITMLEDRFDGGTFFEHGSLDTQRLAGASVDHVHLHYLPIDIDLKALTPELDYVEVDDLSGLSTINSEYLFVRTKNRNYWTKVSSLPSQYFRRIIARIFGVPSMWNWREYPFVNNMVATYNSWLE